MKRLHRLTRQHLRRIILAFLIVVLAALSPTIAAAADSQYKESDMDFVQRLGDRGKALQKRIGELRKRNLAAVRARGMQFSGGGSTNRLAGNTIGQDRARNVRAKSRLPGTSVRSSETLRHKDRAVTNPEFHRIKGELDKLEKKVRAHRREIKKLRAAHGQGESKLIAQFLAQLEREANQIDADITAYETQVAQ